MDMFTSVVIALPCVAAGKVPTSLFAMAAIANSATTF
jgi:hypothetical protein